MLHVGCFLRITALRYYHQRPRCPLAPQPKWLCYNHWARSRSSLPEVLLLPRKRQELFTDDLTVFQRINANLGQLKSLFRVLLGHISLVLYYEPVMRDEWSFR